MERTQRACKLDELISIDLLSSFKQNIWTTRLHTTCRSNSSIEKDRSRKGYRANQFNWRSEFRSCDGKRSSNERKKHRRFSPLISIRLPRTRTLLNEWLIQVIIQAHTKSDLMLKVMAKAKKVVSMTLRLRVMLEIIKDKEAMTKNIEPRSSIRTLQICTSNFASRRIRNNSVFVCVSFFLYLCLYFVSSLCWIVRIF